jgi:heme A synthase
MSKPWTQQTHDAWEVNPDSSEGVRINIGSDYNVEVDKLYGPMCAHLIRVRCEAASGEWVVERQTLDGNTWIECARWDCQLGFEELEDGE